MYSTLIAQHFVFFFLALVSLASFLQGKESLLQRWNENDDEASATCECKVKNEISKLEILITDLNNIKEELQSATKRSNVLVFSGRTNEYAKWSQPANSNSATDRGLTALTSCFWMNTKKASQAPSMLSYAVRTRNNEYLIYLKSSSLIVNLKQRAWWDTKIELSDGKWHHVCVTWKSSDGSVQVYKDGAFETKKTGLAARQRIEPSGIWIIGQDQDSFGGGFQQADAFDGSLTDVNVWDRVLDANEISSLASKNCGLGMQGNYRAYQDFVPQGEVKVVKTSCCD